MGKKGGKNKKGQVVVITSDLGAFCSDKRLKE